MAGHWALLQTLSRHGFYVVEEGDIAVTDSALQQKKPFRKVLAKYTHRYVLVKYTM